MNDNPYLKLNSAIDQKLFTPSTNGTKNLPEQETNTPRPPAKKQAERPAPPATQKPATTIPRYHDTTVDTTTPRHRDTIFETTRRAVKQLGKEAATHRFTIEEKRALKAIEHAYLNRNIRTSENEITRISINYIIEDYRANGESSILAQILNLLNS